MRTHYTLRAFCLLILAVLLGINSNAQHKISGIYYTDSCVFQHFLVGSTDSTISSTNKIEISYGDGTKDTAIIGTGTYYTGYTRFKKNYSSPGTYSIKSVFMNSTGLRIDSMVSSINYIGCSYIKGRLYIDKNSNCIYDAADDTAFFATKIQVDSSGIPIDTIFGYNNFVYLSKGGSGISYEFKPIFFPGGLTPSCPSSGKLSAVSSLGTMVNAGDFGYTCSGSGLDVAIHPDSKAGRHTLYIASTLTSSSCTKTSGTFSMTIDTRYPTFVSTYPTGGVISGRTVTWSYTNLSVTAPKYFFVHCEATTWLTPGTLVTNLISAPYPSGDIDTSNNKLVIIDTVKSSFDPNEKKVSPSGQIASGTTLNYTISFENTGNAPAQNIHILDTLDNNLDPNSMQIITSSHKMDVYKRKDPSTGRTILKFDFPNINLKDSSHKGECDGFVIFSIKTKSGLPKGTNIPNRVGIYFDDNEVVLTNTVSNQINVLDIPKQSKLSNVLIYPNPTDDIFVVKAPKGSYEKLEVINSLGQILLQKPCEGTETHVSTAQLSSGIYYILLKGTNAVNVEKIEKK